MKVVEGFFDGEVIIPVSKKTSECVGVTFKPILRDNYLVRQFLRNEDGSFTSMPSNNVRIMDENNFITCVAAGYYKFVLYGVEP